VGDGSAHLHVLAMVRPSRLPQVIGSFALEWDDILPPVPEHVWQREVGEVDVAVVFALGRGEFGRLSARLNLDPWAPSARFHLYP